MGAESSPKWNSSHSVQLLVPQHHRRPAALPPPGFLSLVAVATFGFFILQLAASAKGRGWSPGTAKATPGSTHALIERWRPNCRPNGTVAIPSLSSSTLAPPPPLFPPTPPLSAPSPSSTPQTNCRRPAALPPPGFLSPVTTPLFAVRPPPSSSSFLDNPPPIFDGGPNRRFKLRPSTSPPARTALELQLSCSICGGERVEMMAMILTRPV